MALVLHVVNLLLTSKLVYTNVPEPYMVKKFLYRKKKVHTYIKFSILG